LVSKSTVAKIMGGMQPAYNYSVFTTVKNRINGANRTNPTNPTNGTKTTKRRTKSYKPSYKRYKPYNRISEQNELSQFRGGLSGRMQSPEFRVRIEETDV
jgi:hypothetical protein